MHLHEFQAKQLLARSGLPVPRGEVAYHVPDALAVATRLSTKRWVVKAQIHAGGRGKAGGVKLVHDKETLKKVVHTLLGQRLVTYQTDAHGQPVQCVLIEEPCDIAKELYLSALIDRSLQRVVVMASTEGGVDIESVAVNTPEKILKIVSDPLLRIMPFQGRQLAFQLGLKEQLISAFSDLVVQLGQLFHVFDMSLVEINPLVITQRNTLLCLDSKINIDDNALYRHPDLKALRDLSQEDESVNHALEWELNYVPLDGNIGCMVNGAGLAMATMDVIQLHGGKPANFLDVGGGTTQERVTEAFKIIVSDRHVKGILVNIFGGIVRCDLIAEGILHAVKEAGLKIPVVVRLEGNHADLGLQLLAKSGLHIMAATGLTDAAKKIVQAVR